MAIFSVILWTFYRGANLTILQVKREDRGRYICEASNGVGNKVSKAVLLEVSFAPTLSTKRPKVGQKEGYQAKLTCKSTSYPPASISFLHDKKELNNNEHYTIEYLGIGNGETEAVLTFNQVKKHHYGVYLCKAKNAFGNAETKLELFGKEVINFISFLPFMFISFSLFRFNSLDFLVLNRWF